MSYDYIDVTPLTEPDPTWVYTDKQGHEHRWVEHGEGCFALPMLCQVIDADATDEHPAIAHLECIQCGERVYPRERTPQHRQYMRVKQPR